MTAAPPRIHVVRFTPAELLDRLTEALRVYVTAMHYPRSAIRQRAPLWREHASRSGWRGVGALDNDGSLLGLGYGYRGAPGQWWHEEVRRGLIAGRSPNIQWLSDYFELTELHVLPAAQGRGLGESLLRLLVSDYPSSSVLLSTPELDQRNPARAWRLYRRLGFVDVLRHHCFVGDPRPFAVLGSPLPLPDSPPTRRP
ncbi:MAG TPA: GNAT family N-acetyltransferase [Pseudonocardia sp.]|jgi:ribosomal protein S18 acetylase RimI-like enzyme|nr:GNAT family N-acetyltransferase [Pseudonocardia sp.]